MRCVVFGRDDEAPRLLDVSAAFATLDLTNPSIMVSGGGPPRKPKDIEREMKKTTTKSTTFSESKKTLIFVI